MVNGARKYRVNKRSGLLRVPYTLMPHVKGMIQEYNKQCKAREKLEKQLNKEVTTDMEVSVSS